jgi:hypothetical protein
LTAWSPPRLTALPALREYLLAAALVGGVAWGGLQALHVYQEEILPHRRQPATPAPRPRGVRADDPAAVRRFQRVVDALGEATTYANAGRHDWARSTVEEILTLDPGNADALKLRDRIDREAPPK